MKTKLLLLVIAGALTASACGNSGANAPESTQQTEVESMAETLEGTSEEADGMTEQALPAETQGTTEEREETGADAPTAMQEQNVNAPIRVLGKVTEITEDSILISNDTEGERYPEIKLNITDDTLFLDSTDGSEVSIDSVKQGDTLTAYVSQAMTRSIPPMTNAEVVLCNMTDTMSAPNYAEILSVEEGEEGVLDVMTNQSVIYHIYEDTEITLQESGDAISASELETGMKLVAWYDIVMESHPAQANPLKVVVLP